MVVVRCPAFSPSPSPPSCPCCAYMYPCVIPRLFPHPLPFLHPHRASRRCWCNHPNSRTEIIQITLDGLYVCVCSFELTFKNPYTRSQCPVSPLSLSFSLFPPIFHSRFLSFLCSCARCPQLTRKHPCACSRCF